MRRDRRTWKIGWGRFSFAGGKSRRNDASCVVTEGQGRLVGGRFSFAGGKRVENKKTSNKSLFLNRKTLHLHNVRCGGVPLGQLLREAEASAVANRAPISLGRHKKQVNLFSSALSFHYI